VKKVKQKLINRLTTYVKFDTKSNEESTTCPTTVGQLDLAKYLAEELQQIGMVDITIDENGYLFATLPTNTTKDVPTIGFLAHLDTSPDFSGYNVQPKLVENYDGENIVLNKELNIVLSPKDFPNLKNYVGHTLMTTDGTTLLGADNKNGIAEIMTAMEYLINHPEIEHGKIRVAFTPDEEIGRGPHLFNVEAFGAKYAYTMDGGPVGELTYESFNACAVKVIVKGSNIHPGTAKDKMVNAIKIAMDFNSQLPTDECPEKTEGYEGFYHLNSINGEVENTVLNYIIRDFDRTNFENRKNTLKEIARTINANYVEPVIELVITDQYFNMKEKIEPVMEIVDIAKEAMHSLNITPVIVPIRGGTDGSQLSYMGMPTPNIFTGGENYHGKYEFASIDDMEKATKVIINMAELFAK